MIPKQNGSTINNFELVQELRQRDGIDRDEKLFATSSDFDLLRMFNKVNSAFLFSRFKRRLMPISPISEDSIEPHAKLRYPLIGTSEYIQADLNMAFISLITQDAPTDKIMLALLMDKKFAADISKLRVDTCDKKSETVDNAKTIVNTMIKNVPEFPCVKVDPIERQATGNFIMAANINPIALNYVDNLKQIKDQIDEACRKGATLLVFPEFTLTGHDLDDAVRFVRNQHTELMLTHIAEYAKQRSGSTLTVAMGHPWSPNNNINKADRSQRFVSAMSILSNGSVEKMIVRSEPYQMPGKNKPYYQSRQMRALNDYHETVKIGDKDVQITSDQHYEINHNDDKVKLAFCFETPKQSQPDVITVQVAGKLKPGTTNSIYVKQRGAPAASTCAKGSIILTDKAGKTHAYTKPYSLADVNAATFGVSAQGEVIATSLEAPQFSDKEQKERKIASWLYAYLKSAPIKFQITLNGQIDSVFNIKMARSAIAQRFADLGNLALNLKLDKICGELGIKRENIGSHDVEDSAINALLNEKLIVLDLSSDPIQLPAEFNYIKPIHAPANDKLLDKIINEVRKVYDKPDTPLNRESIKKRYLSAISWMIAADKGTIPFCNGTRTDLGLNNMTFGGDLHQGPLSPSMHLSRTEIAEFLNVELSQEELNNDILIDHFSQTNPLVNLQETYFNNVVDVAMFNQFKQVYFKWHEGQLSRNALPILLETGKSPDKQTAHREMPFAQPLKHEFVELVLKLMFPKTHRNSNIIKSAI